MISGTCWVRKGAAAPVPQKFTMTEEQYQDIMERTKWEVGEARKSLKMAQEGQEKKQTTLTMEIDEDLQQFNMEDYSDDNNNNDVSSEMDQDFLHAFSNIDEAALADKDEYLNGKHQKDEEEEEDEEEVEDLNIRPDDLLLVATKTEDEVSYLETYVYEVEAENLYVHHDVMLPAFPLCVEWIGAPLNSKAADSELIKHGNFAAVGTFEPEIEIWNLDVLETPLPDIILGAHSEDHASNSKKKLKKKKSTKCLTKLVERHTDAVMCLAWNKMHASLILSGSADTTVKLWDLYRSTQALRSFDHHSGKVQAVQWNPREISVLASAAYDKTVQCFDCRTNESIMRWELPNVDPECLRWNPHEPHNLTVSDEQGRVFCWDTRAGSGSSPLFTLQAHGKPVTSIDWNPSFPNCLLTISADKSLKLWNTQAGNITCVVSRELSQVGKAFSGSFCSDAPNLVCVAGSKGVLTVMDLFHDSAVVNGFRNNES